MSHLAAEEDYAPHPETADEEAAYLARMRHSAAHLMAGAVFGRLAGASAAKAAVG